MLVCNGTASRTFARSGRPPPGKEGTAIATGTVKWYDLEKGYGFVYEDGANRDVFLHSADIQEPEPKVLYEGHRVRFEVEESERGPRAVEVLVITGTERIDPALDNPIPDIKDDLERAEDGDEPAATAEQIATETE